MTRQRDHTFEHENIFTGEFIVFDTNFLIRCAVISEIVKHKRKHYNMIVNNNINVNMLVFEKSGLPKICYSVITAFDIYTQIEKYF